jgi:hypothetical protein
MTQAEVKRVIDFLIEEERKQFRLIWTSFEQSVNLFINKEVMSRTAGSRYSRRGAASKRSMHGPRKATPVGFRPVHRQ